MRRILLALSLALAPQALCAADYLPPLGDAWAAHTPQQEGLDAVKLKSAIDFAVAHETKLAPDGRGQNSEIRN